MLPFRPGWTIVAVASALLCIIPGRAGAQAPPAGGRAEAEPKAPSSSTLELSRATVSKLLDRADAAVLEDDLDGAIKALRAAYDRHPSREVACNRGLVASGLRLYKEAVEYLTRCTSGAQPSPEDADRYATLRAELALAEEEIKASSAPASPSAAPSAPVAGAPIRPEKIVAPSPPAPPIAPGKMRFLVGGAVLTGVAAVLGGVFLGVAQSKFNDAEATFREDPLVCGVSGNSDCVAFLEQQRDGNAFRQRAAISLATGGAAAVGTFIFALVPVKPAPAIQAQGLALGGVW